MMDASFTISWLSILCAFLAYFVLGGLWFTVLFKRPYALSLGKHVDTLQNNAPIFYIGPAICSLVITATTAILLTILEVNAMLNAFKFALLVGFGYLFANTVNIAINPNIPRPLLYGIISGAFHLVGILLVCIILTAMQ